MITTARWPEFRFGEKVHATGILETPFESEEFSYEKYLARHSIFSEMRRPRLKSLGFREELESPLRWEFYFARILKWKDLLTERIGKVFPEPEASFLDGLLTGARKGLPPKVSDEFQRAGLTHIVAVSGFNITIVAAALLAVFGRISRRVGAVAAAAGIFFFVVFSGASAAAVRAGLMGGIAALALFSGRQAHAATALLLAANLLAWWQPLILTRDVGFQLSFLATAGILFLFPLLEKAAERFPALFGLREAFLLTIAAQLAVLPLLAWHFERISVVAPLSNLAAAPFLVFATGAGFAAVVVGFFSVGLGIFAAVPAHFAMTALLKIAAVSAAVPFAEVEVSFPAWLLTAWYLGGAALISWLWQSWKPESEILSLEKPAATRGSSS